MAQIKICVSCGYMNERGDELFCVKCAAQRGDLSPMLSEQELTDFINYCKAKKFEAQGNIYKRRRTQIRSGYMGLDTILPN